MAVQEQPAQELTPEQKAALQQAITMVADTFNATTDALAAALVEITSGIRAQVRKSLKDWRLNAGLTQKAAAAAIGVSNDTIKRWESGETFPTVPDIEKISKAYGVHFDKIDFDAPKE